MKKGKSSQPKADQPRRTEASLKMGAEKPSLQYRVSNVKNITRSPARKQKRLSRI